MQRHGRFPSWTEDDYVRWPLEERRLLRALEDAIGHRTDILIELLGRGEWELGFACFYELHDGGHALFVAMDSGAPRHDPRRAAFGQVALLCLYKAADAGLGRLREAVGAGVDLLVCSGKGFRPNTNGESILPGRSSRDRDRDWRERSKRGTSLPPEVLSAAARSPTPDSGAGSLFLYGAGGLLVVLVGAVLGLLYRRHTAG